MIKKQTNIDLSSFKRDFEKNGYYIFRNILKKQFIAILVLGLWLYRSLGQA